MADLFRLVRQLNDDEFEALMEMLHTMPGRHGRLRDDAAALREASRLVAMVWNAG